jgi:hypothetical protein
MIGQGLQVVALFDSDDEGRRQEARLRTKWLTRYKGNTATTLLLGTVVKAIDDFAIEDLFDGDYYTQCALATHDGTTKNKTHTITPTGTGVLCERVARACNRIGVPFNKGSVANTLRKRLRAAKTLDELPPGTSEKARALFTAIRDACQRIARTSAAG